MKIFRNRTVIGVLCILLSLVICFGITPLFNKSASEKAVIVRVAKDIHAGDEITANMVQTVEVGAYNLPTGVLTEESDVVGKYATADLTVGDYLLSAKLSDEPAAENSYLYRLDGTKQAMSVTIKSFATGLSGKLKSGDIVSIIVSDYKGKGETVIPAELQYVEVISVTASSGYDANTERRIARTRRSCPAPSPSSSPWSRARCLPSWNRRVSSTCPLYIAGKQKKPPPLSKRRTPSLKSSIPIRQNLTMPKKIR